MERQQLIDQVKAEYARLADLESREDFTGRKLHQSPEAYYEKLLNKVIHGIEEGKYDHCGSGLEIVQTVSFNNEQWSTFQ